MNNRKAILLECAGYHDKRAKKHKDARLFRERCHVGPAHSTLFKSKRRLNCYQPQPPKR